MAGSVLALKLMEKGSSVIVIDKPELSNCSKIAAGIWNPVVFKRLTKSWMVDDLLPEMLRFYRMIEKKFDQNFITERDIVRLFSEQQEADLWIKKAKGELSSYLDKKIYTESYSPNIKQSEFGYSKVLHSGNLDVKSFLDAARNYFKREDCYVEENFDHKQLSISEKIIYKDNIADKIIFSEGYLIKHNPFFNYIPLKPAKGEVIDFESEELKMGSEIVNKNAFVFSTSNNKFKCGATYNWEDLNDEISESGLKDLEAKITKIVNLKLSIVNQAAGVRPSVIDRRPVLGKHPQYNNLFVFNGLGTKGVMLAPYFAEVLINFLKNEMELNSEINVERFKKFFVN